jgi:hypothetical protein
MTREDIIRMAREVWGDDSGKPWSESALLHLEAFANLVAAAEREECVKVVQEWLHGDWHNAGVVAVTMIRERGAP